jgi:hypothetical protein
MVRADDYEQLKAWLGFIFEQLALAPPELSPDLHPVAILGQMEKSSPSKARRGLSEAIGDTIEISAQLQASDVDLIDEKCRVRGLPTLSEVRSRFSKKLKAVVRRGVIRSEAEYYLVRNAMERTPDEVERTKLQALLNQFENI